MALDTRFPAGMTTFVYNGMCLTPLDIPISHKEKHRKPLPNSRCRFNRQGAIPI
jgi:hypothetical protein